jgi:Zn-finger nucleic acid-binding protein
MCGACGGEAVDPQRAAAMRDALGDDVFKGVVGMSRACSFCDAAMVRQSAVHVTVDVCTACGAWFLDRGERERLGQLADAKARGVDLTPAPPPTPRPVRRAPTWKDHAKRAATVAAVLGMTALVLFTAAMAIWGASNKSPGRVCTSNCECAHNEVCMGGSCDRMLCKTGFLSTRDCVDGYRCAKTTSFMTANDRTRYDGECRRNTSCPR